MLVIARKAGQALCIGPDIRIEVREIRSLQVKLTISAPADVTILRTEIEENSTADLMTGIAEDRTTETATQAGSHEEQGDR